MEATPPAKTPETKSKKVSPGRLRLSRSALTAGIILTPLLSVAIAALLLLNIHKHWQKAEGSDRAEEVAQYEIKRLVADMNHKLNALREELIHLYQEQSALGKAATEAEKVKALFYHRDYLAAFAVLISNPATPNQLDVHKYFIREGGLVPDGVPSSARLMDVFKSASAKAQTAGFHMERLDPKLLEEQGAAPTATTGTTWFVVAYTIPDETTRITIFTGIYRASYLFPFCKFFGDAFGRINSNAFVLDDRGIVVCHNIARFEGLSFKELPFFAEIVKASASGPNGGFARYKNQVENDVVAAVKPIQPGGLYVIAEATNVPPWDLAVPSRELSVAFGFVLIATLVVTIFLASRTGRGLDLSSIKPVVSGDAVTRNWAKEIEELQATVLEQQTESALIAGLEQACSEAMDSGTILETAFASVGRLSSIEGQVLPCAWLYHDAKAGVLQGAFAMGAFSADVVNTVKIEYKEKGVFKKHDEVFAVVSPKLGTDVLTIQAVFAAGELLGVFVIGGKRADHPRMSLVPQIAQIAATALRGVNARS